MEEVRGPNRRSYIAGPSVPNTRIERLWRDVYTAVASTFVNMFCSLEQCGYLDPTNEADLFALHFIFLPRINAALTAFKSAWNSHPLSTEGNRTPLQLFTAHASVDPNFDTTSPGEDFGIDPTDPGPEEPDDNLVEVPETNIPLSAASMQALHASVNPLAETSDGGINLYTTAVDCLFQLMQAENLLEQ